MRKSTKIAMLVAAIVLLASLTVFAKGWQQDEYGWYFEDAYGMMEYLKWEKSGSNYYYLGEDGYMVTNDIVQDSNGAKYWVGPDGAKVTNQWVPVPADDYDVETYGVDHRWFWFGSTGKACTTNVTLDGKKYFFDVDGKMLFGYHDGVQIIATDVPFNGSVYYSGSNDDGAMVKDIWYRIDVTDQEAYDEATFRWVYYKTNGKKATSATNANGLVWKAQRYFFDSEGRMLYSYNEVSTSKATNTTMTAYLSGSDDGHMVKKAWVYDYAELDTDEEDGKHWYYFDAAGQAVNTEMVKKINGKYYAFAAKAGKDLNAYRMQYGFVAVDKLDEKEAITTGIPSTKIDTTAITVDEWKKGKYANVYYFSGDEVNDGSLKKAISVNNVEFYDDYANVVIDKTGKVANGAYNSRYYANGILLGASVEDRYAVIETADGFKLLSTSGAAVKSGVAIDGDGNYFIVKKVDKVETIYRVGNYLDYAVRAAQAVNSGKETFIADGDTYKVFTGSVGTEGYAEVTYEIVK